MALKINFGFMYRFTNSWPHLSRTDSAVGKPKITTVQIFLQHRQGVTVYVFNVYVLSVWKKNKHTHPFGVSGIDVSYGRAGLWPAIHTPTLGVSGWKEAKRTKPFGVSWMDVSCAWVSEFNGGEKMARLPSSFPWVELALGHPYTLTPS